MMHYVLSEENSWYSTVFLLKARACFFSLILVLLFLCVYPNVVKAQVSDFSPQDKKEITVAMFGSEEDFNALMDVRSLNGVIPQEPIDDGSTFWSGPTREKKRIAAAKFLIVITVCFVVFFLKNFPSPWRKSILRCLFGKGILPNHIYSGLFRLWAAANGLALLFCLYAYFGVYREFDFLYHLRPSILSNGDEEEAIVFVLVFFFASLFPWSLITWVWRGFLSDPQETMADSSTVDASREEALFLEAVKIVQTEKKASISFIQRHLQIGYNMAARIVDRLEKEGIVSTPDHMGQREIYD